MVAFKEEFPYLRCDSGQLFEYDQAWLHAVITRAADQAGYPRWWLTDHVTESIPRECTPGERQHRTGHHDGHNSLHHLLALRAL
jgi:hypothetical protein